MTYIYLVVQYDEDLPEAIIEAWSTIEQAQARMDSLMGNPESYYINMVPIDMTESQYLSELEQDEMQNVIVPGASHTTLDELEDI